MSLLRPRSRLRSLALLAALCGWCALAAAQQGSAAGTDGRGTGTTTGSGEAGNETAQPAKPAPAKSKDSFTPSEEVSEDLSVSFPVDI